MPLAHFGLTGGIGSGKSLVGGYFRELGVPVVDADDLARSACAPGQPALAEIAATFGDAVLRNNGSLDRAALAHIVFADVDKLERLNGIVHPRVQQLLDQELQRLEAQGHQLMCYEVPLLFERGLDARFRPVVVVNATGAQQISRTLQRDGATEEQVRQRMSHQLPLADKARRADYVIDNSGSREQTRAQTASVLRQVCGDLNVPLPSVPAS